MAERRDLWSQKRDAAPMRERNGSAPVDSLRSFGAGGKCVAPVHRMFEHPQPPEPESPRREGVPDVIDTPPPDIPVVPPPDIPPADLPDRPRPQRDLPGPR
jgi:hypothetical protein